MPQLQHTARRRQVAEVVRTKGLQVGRRQVTPEEAFQNKILALCRWYRLRTYHTYDSRRSPSGFPDLVIVGKGGVVFAELKSATGKVSLAQQEWWEDLKRAGAEAYIWYPADWEKIQTVLKRLAGHHDR
jgi:hypothetical protein